MAVELATAYVNIIPTFGGKGGATQFGRELSQMADQAGRAAGTKAGQATSSSLGAALSGASEAVASKLGAPVASAAGAAGAQAGRQYGLFLTGAMAATLGGSAQTAVAQGLSPATAAAERAGSEAGRAYAQRMATSMGMLSGSQRTRFEQQLTQQFDAQIPRLFAAMNPAFGQAGEQAARTWGQRFRDGIGGAIAGLGSQGVANFGSNLTSAGLGLTTAVTAPLAAIGVGSTRAAMQFESAFAGVVKTVDATDAELSTLRDGIRQMALEIPATREEIAGVAEAAGQLGISTPNILEFTRVMIDLGNATNLTGEQAAQTLARFANITQMPQSDFDRLGSTIVALGNNFATTEAEIAELGLRLAGAGNQVGLTEAQILSISTALSSVGVEAEAGGTAFSRVLADMASAAKTGGDELDGFARIAGTTAEEFGSLFERDASGALVSFVDGLNRVAESGGNVFAALESVGLSEIRVRDALLRSAGAGDLLKQALDEGSKAWEENTALTREAEARYATAESRMQIFRNQLSDVGVTLGEALLPALQSLVQAMGPVLDLIELGAEAFAALPGPVQTGIVALGAFAAAAGPVTFVAGNLITSLNSISSAFTAAKSAGAGNWTAAASGLQTVAGKAGLAAVAIAGFTLAWQENQRALQAGLDALALDNEDIIPAFDPGNVREQTLAIEEMARVIGQLDEVGPQGAWQQLLDWGAIPFSESFDFETGNRVKLAEQAVEDFRAVLKTLPVDLDVARDAVDRVEESLIRQGLSAKVAAERVKPLRDAIADQEVTNRATKGIQDHSAAVDGLGDEFTDAEGEADALDRAIARLTRRQTLASFAFDAATAAADGYAQAIERTTRSDELASAASSAGRALVQLREGLKAETDQADEAEKTTDALREALDRMRNAADAADPALSTLGIRMGSASSAADAFSSALKSSSFLDDQLSAAVNLGTAYRDFRLTFRRLPGDVDLADAAMGKYRKRQTEAINNTIALGNATAEYLATLIRSGRTQDQVREEAARLRAEYERQFRQAGFNEAQIRKYLEVLNLTPKQVETSLRLSGVESARFRINSYLQLLEGKIPAHIATAVTAAIERQDLEGAAQILARFAATNPMEIPVEPKVEERVVEEAKAKLQPILGFDPISAALGRYTEEQYAWLDQILQFGDAATQTIGEVFASTKNRDTALAAGRSLREALVSELGNIPGIDELITAAGLQDWQIVVALDEAAFAETTFKVNALLSLLEADLTPEERWQIALELTDDDATNDLDTLMSALERLEAEPTAHDIEIRTHLARNSLVGQILFWRDSVLPTIPVAADTDPAKREVDKFKQAALTPVTTPLDADDTKAVEEHLRYISLVTGIFPEVPLDANDTRAVAAYFEYVRKTTGQDIPLPLDADDDAAWETYLSWVSSVESARVQIPVGLDTTSLNQAMANLRRIIGSGGFGTPYRPDILELGYGQDFNRNGVIGREFGGPVNAGMPYIVGEKRPELFIPDRSGHIIPNLDALEPQDSGRIGEVSIHPTYNEVREAPTPEDLARGVRSELWLAGLW